MGDHGADVRVEAVFAPVGTIVSQRIGVQLDAGLLSLRVDAADVAVEQGRLTDVLERGDLGLT